MFTLSKALFEVFDEKKSTACYTFIPVKTMDLTTEPNRPQLGPSVADGVWCLTDSALLSWFPLK